MRPLDIACGPPPLLPPPTPRVMGIACRALGCAALLVLVLGLVVAPRGRRCCFCIRSDTAKVMVARFANEAYPSWRRAHPGRTCPFGLGELAPYMDGLDPHDPWGRFYQFTCGVDRIYVMSLGEDHLLGTEDDIWSQP